MIKYYICEQCGNWVTEAQVLDALCVPNHYRPSAVLFARPEPVCPNFVHKGMLISMALVGKEELDIIKERVHAT